MTPKNRRQAVALATREVAQLAGELTPVFNQLLEVLQQVDARLTRLEARTWAGRWARLRAWVRR